MPYRHKQKFQIKKEIKYKTIAACCATNLRLKKKLSKPYFKSIIPELQVREERKQ